MQWNYLHDFSGIERMTLINLESSAQSLILNEIPIYSIFSIDWIDFSCDQTCFLSYS